EEHLPVGGVPPERALEHRTRSPERRTDARQHEVAGEAPDRAREQEHVHEVGEQHAPEEGPWIGAEDVEQAGEDEIANEVELTDEELAREAPERPGGNVVEVDEVVVPEVVVTDRRPDGGRGEEREERREDGGARGVVRWHAGRARGGAACGSLACSSREAQRRRLARVRVPLTAEGGGDSSLAPNGGG